MSNGARWRLKPPAPRLFTPPFVQSQIQENSKAPRHWPLYRWLNFPHKGPVTRKMFPFDDVVMSCFYHIFTGGDLGTGVIVWVSPCQWSFPVWYGYHLMPGYEIVGFVGVCSCVHDHTCWSWKKNTTIKYFNFFGVSNVACCFLISFDTFPNV